MNARLTASLCCALFLFGCQSVPDKGARGTWTESTLSEQTLKKIQADSFDYQQCLHQQLMGEIPAETDESTVTDMILGRCEERLKPIKATFDAEKVPDDISSRYLEKKRSYAKRNVMRFVRSVQAAQAAEAASKPAAIKSSPADPPR
ncbi:hypothetical protein RP726_15500 [Candidatus Methylospira mobilis]|uniref:hypothetical protein n=1 Tax=Candidatus Methylospira mobilis TaxID=1808979 RepID=UPI0028E5CB4E|nr:hypothetical protein [Candidatus Methylospira mobilis]WNV03829.1 hypothetical protein RP726_15500 [Candidatus Methylospira mobilis]